MGSLELMRTKTPRTGKDSSPGAAAGIDGFPPDLRRNTNNLQMVSRLTI